MGRMVLGISSLWLLLVILSFSWNFKDAQLEQREIAYQAARSFFQQILITRSWNASHGGIYVPVTESTRPNPYLDTAMRDIRVNDQLTLTKINPAYMTRQIAELAAKHQRDIQFHITSLNPLRPENRANKLEAKTLAEFENGLEEYAQLVIKNNQPRFFYMAPLVTDRTCLKCHAKQGYQVGDIRGGISVTLPYTEYAGLTPLLFGHLAIGIVGVFGIAVAGKKLERAYRTIKNQSDTDFLTGLDNRRAFLARIQHAIKVAHREKKVLALLLMDLDRFKEVNDSFGHPAGDELLQLIAKRLRDNLREADTISRQGGDEFALLLEGLSETKDAAQVANKILSLFEKTWQLSGNIDVQLGVSIGIALFPAHGDNYDELFQHADTALYKAKSAGRQRFYFFSENPTKTENNAD
ncbi:MAG: diguanylate cyclase [Amphritea sp.]